MPWQGDKLLSSFNADRWSGAVAYQVDSPQRAILLSDLLGERGNDDLEHEATGQPPVLTFEQDLARDGVILERP